MINFSFNISNPFNRRWALIKGFSGRLFDHKAWEINFYKTSCLISGDFGLNINSDHAGVRSMVGLFGFEAEIHFYDIRHWNSEKEEWERYDQDY
jgi:hypothetical protein